MLAWTVFRCYMRAEYFLPNPRARLYGVGAIKRAERVARACIKPTAIDYYRAEHHFLYSCRCYWGKRGKWWRLPPQQSLEPIPRFMCTSDNKLRADGTRVAGLGAPSRGGATLKFSGKPKPINQWFISYCSQAGLTHTDTIK